jgi:hypothetical protein
MMHWVALEERAHEYVSRLCEHVQVEATAGKPRLVKGMMEVVAERR